MATKKKQLNDIPQDCMPLCSSCVFGQVEAGEIGCKRFPPVFITDDSSGGFAFPIMRQDDWCGEFIRRVN